MAERTVEELANDFTSTGANPGGISNSILASTGGSGGVGYIPPYAIDPYTSPYIQSRLVFFTINTYTNLSREGISAKAFLNGVEIDGQTSTKGTITFTLSEQLLLNPSTLTFVSGDLKPQRYFLIQARKDVENEVSIIEYDVIGDTSPSPLLGTPLPSAEGFTRGASDTVGRQYDGTSGGGGGGGFTEVDRGDGRIGRDRIYEGGRENIQ